MDVEIVPVSEKDIDDVESIARKSFYKFNLTDYGFDYNSAYVKEIVRGYIINEALIVNIAKCKKKVFGFMASSIVNGFFSPTLELRSMQMLTDPELYKTTQSRIILKFIKWNENFAKLNKLKITGFNIIDKYEICSHLEKKNYQLSDKIYLKKGGT